MKTKISPIPKEISSLISKDGFVSAYMKEIPNHKFKQQAYEAIEKKYFSYFGSPRYSNYGTFRNMLVRWRKKTKD